MRTPRGTGLCQATSLQPHFEAHRHVSQRHQLHRGDALPPLCPAGPGPQSTAKQAKGYFTKTKTENLGKVIPTLPVQMGSLHVHMAGPLQVRLCNKDRFRGFVPGLTAQARVTTAPVQRALPLLGSHSSGVLLLGSHLLQARGSSLHLTQHPTE